MSIRKAELSDLNTVKNIVRITIQKIYPHYYPKGAVDFFIEHHNDNNIINDIMQNRVFICFDLEHNIVGTVTIKENEILRLFVLPNHQGKGYGRELLDYAEKSILNNYSEVIIDASFPAKGIYLKRGYKEIEYNMIKTNNGDLLCYDVMKKSKEN